MWCFLILCFPWSCLSHLNISKYNFVFSTFFIESCLLKDEVNCFLRTEELKKSLPKLICVSLAQCCLQQCCWTFHRSLVDPCNLMPDTPSASVSAVLRSIFPCLIPLMSVLKALVWMYLSCLSPSPTCGRSHSQRFPAHSRKRDCSCFSQFPCAVKALTRFLPCKTHQPPSQLWNMCHILPHLSLLQTWKIPVYSQKKTKIQIKRKMQTPSPTQAPWQNPETIVFYACSKWHLSHSGFRNVQFPWFHVATAGFVLSKR